MMREPPRFDDFAPGAAFHSRTRTITETDIVSFAGLSGDYVELHVSEAYAATTPHGRRIAHGALVFSVSTGLSAQMGLVNDIVLAFAGVDHLRFVEPVFIGDTLAVSKRVLERRAMAGDRGLLRFDTRVTNQHGRTVLAYVDKLVVRAVCNPGSDSCLIAGEARHEGVLSMAEPQARGDVDD